MSGILKREVILDNFNGCYRPHDWSVVTTEIGTMMEPCSGIFPRFSVNTPAREYDASDMIARVDEIRMYDLGKVSTLCGDRVTFGTINPRTGR